MNLETFFEKFDLFADCPNAVQKMRELILELAVQGKLVEQDEGDEPGSSLLAHIIKEREGLIKARQIKKQEVDDAVPEGLVEIPKNWIWTRLGVVGDWGSGSTPPRGNSEYYGGNVPWLKSGELNDLRNLSGSEETVTEYAVEKCSFRRNVTGDVLLAMYGATIGKVAILAAPAVTNQAVCGCTPMTGVSNSYLYFYLLSQRADFHAASEGGAQPNISKQKILAYPFPLPPLAEQKRIVAKVDELMALCDALEAQQKERETKRTALAKASLAAFAEAPSPQSLELLFHPSYAIDPADLRKSILTLAVQGKLVEQREEESHICSSNSQLPAQLKELASAIGVRFAEPEELISSSDDLPMGWGVVKLKNIGITQTGTTPSKSDADYSGNDIPFIKPGDIKSGLVDYSNEGLSLAGLDAGRLIPEGSILMVSIGGSIGKMALVDRRVSCNQQINCITPVEFASQKFIFYSMAAPSFQDEVLARAAQGTLAIISKSKWEAISIALPPLAEQKRIVAKVDELMALVDRLESKEKAARETASRLLDAMVAELSGRVAA